MGQTAKMSMHGKAAWGKTEHRKELGQILMMHPDAYIAQVSPAYYNHFMRAVSAAMEYPGPSVIIAYAACMPEHGIPDDAGFARSMVAVQSRAFPLFTYDPRNGPNIRDRLDLRGNPSISEDWHVDAKTGVVYDFTLFVRGETRFAHLFDEEGNPKEHVAEIRLERLENWRRLKELAGFR
jgi:pyruvate/2-oxoacid:ferredoxin oxidoreductase beta subunit